MEQTIAFYNLENLFDTKDDPTKIDDDFTPKGRKKWKPHKLKGKLEKLGKVIASIGPGGDQTPPALVGVAEVENKEVLERLLQTKHLKDLPYGIVHFDSQDERGIDTALLYYKPNFEVLASEAIPLLLENEDGDQDYTRDILFVDGILNGERVRIFVNHWPSRRAGAALTEPKRIKAAETIIEKIESLGLPPEGLNCIIMGDFNDDPNSPSIAKLMDSGWFHNPMKPLLSHSMGSSFFKGQWNLFDQIILSHSFLNYSEGTHVFRSADIFSPEFIKKWKGRNKGTPFRTFEGKKFVGGYSDHFPVYVILEI